MYDQDNDNVPSMVETFLEEFDGWRDMYTRIRARGASPVIALAAANIEYPYRYVEVN